MEPRLLSDETVIRGVGFLTEEQLDAIITRADPNLSGREKELLRATLKANEDVFSMVLLSAGNADHIPHAINTRDLKSIIDINRTI